MASPGRAARSSAFEAASRAAAADQFAAALATLEARLAWRFVAALVAQTLAIIGAVFALMRMFPAN